MILPLLYYWQVITTVTGPFLHTATAAPPPLIPHCHLKSLNPLNILTDTLFANVRTKYDLSANKCVISEVLHHTDADKINEMLKKKKTGTEPLNKIRLQ